MTMVFLGFFNCCSLLNWLWLINIKLVWNWSSLFSLGLRFNGLQDWDLCISFSGFFFPFLKLIFFLKFYHSTFTLLMIKLFFLFICLLYAFFNRALFIVSHSFCQYIYQLFFSEVVSILWVTFIKLQIFFNFTLFYLFLSFKFDPHFFYCYLFCLISFFRFFFYNFILHGLYSRGIYCRGFIEFIIGKVTFGVRNYSYNGCDNVFICDISIYYFEDL